MRASEPRVVVDGLHFPECLRWYDGRLYFSDMLAGTVHRASGTGDEVEVIAEVPGDSGGLGRLPDGDLLIVAMRERRIVRLAPDGALHPHADLRALLEHPANDMYVDEHGRAYVGSYGFDADHDAPVRRVPLAVVEPDGSARLAGDPLTFPNGIDRYGDRELLVAETYGDRVTRIPIGEDGTPGPGHPLVTVEPGWGPDGICCDGAGGVWVACAMGERAVHVTPSGAIDEIIPVPGRGVLCCLLGGPGRRTLYLAVACLDEEYAARVKTGSILAVDLDGRPGAR